MYETMGQVIKRLRKEQNLTQEELAERLNLSAPAISKWEHDGGLPDISQIVPLSRIFGVSTDVLFGVADINDEKKIKLILEKAQSTLTRPLTAECLKNKYEILKKGLETYPKSTRLLMECLETGIALAYPENSVFDPVNGKMFYKECIRLADKVFVYSQNTTDILRAHMIMVQLHSAYGSFELARSHAKNFPWRSDMTVHLMYACCAHWQKDYQTEAASCRYGFMYLLDAMLNMMAQLSGVYALTDERENSKKTLEKAVALIDLLAGEEAVAPPLHYREKGNLYVMLAKEFLRDNDAAGAVALLEKAVTYEVEKCARFSPAPSLKSPLLQGTERYHYRLPVDRLREMVSSLNDPCFAPLWEDDRFQTLLKKAETIRF